MRIIGIPSLGPARDRCRLAVGEIPWTRIIRGIIHLPAGFLRYLDGIPQIQPLAGDSRRRNESTDTESGGKEELSSSLRMQTTVFAQDAQMCNDEPTRLRTLSLNSREFLTLTDSMCRVATVGLVPTEP
jgi:hypothetical protein